MEINFNLRISLKENGSCIFYLSWDQGRRDLFASQVFTPQLRRDYRIWQRAYLKYYSLPNDENLSRSGGLSLSTGDPSSIVRNEESAFLSRFLDWLGSGEIRLIERQLQTSLLDIGQTGDDEIQETSHINIYLACNARFLSPLPWEYWVKSLIPKSFSEDSIRLIRTSNDDPDALSEIKTPRLHKKPRILAILGFDKNLSLNQDWQVLKTLKSVANIERATFSHDAKPQDLVQEVLAQITDDRGWDILFFAGHSDDKANTSGSFQLTETVSLSMREIAEHLEVARDYGLNLAIFNSCCGLAIAQSLTRMGIQSVVMREKIHNDVAIVFLEQLCFRLKQYKDIHTSLLETCNFLRENENIKFPSAHLIASFFSPPRKSPYCFKRRSWQDKLRRLTLERREIVFASCALFLSSLSIIPSMAIEARVALQSVYRELTKQHLISSEKLIHVIAVDQESLETFAINLNAEENIPHDFIANIINQISDYTDPEIVGISYILNDQTQESELLLNTIKDVNKKHDSWFVTTNSETEGLMPYDELQALPMNFQGDSYFYFWDVDTPDDQDKENFCPFAYNLSLLYTLKQDEPFSSLLDLGQQIQEENQRLTNQNLGKDFCKSFLDYIKKNSPKVSETQNFIIRSQSRFGWLSIIDFSVPPNIVYERTVVSDLESLRSRNISESIFLIGSGSYREAQDNYTAPLAMGYWWCLSPSLKQDQTKNCKLDTPRYLSFAETHAYMAAQLLQNKQLRVIPNYLMIFSSIILSKTLILVLESYSLSQRQKVLRYIYPSIIGYIALSFQLYISISILFPILFPVLTFLYYLRPTIKSAYR